MQNIFRHNYRFEVCNDRLEICFPSFQRQLVSQDFLVCLEDAESMREDLSLSSVSFKHRKSQKPPTDIGSFLAAQSSNCQLSALLRNFQLSGLLQALLPDLSALQEIPAGPIRFHGKNSALQHTLETIRRAEEKKLPFKAIASLIFHDIGKQDTPPEKWPSHHNHHKYSKSRVDAILEKADFSKEEAEFISLFAYYHSAAHTFENVKPGKILKLVEKFKSNEDWQLFLETCDCDHAIDAKLLRVFSDFFSIADAAQKRFIGKKDATTSIDEQLLQYKIEALNAPLRVSRGLI